MGTLVFQATLGGSVNLIGPNTASTINFTLPSADGSSGQALTTNGSGTLAFSTVTTGAAGSTTQVQYNSSGAFAGSANMTFNGTTLALAGLSNSGTTTLSGLTASTALALDASKNVVSVTNTGSGSNVLATSPTLVTPILGTPTSATLTNATGLPLSTGVTGTLPVANGGTGLTTTPANGALDIGNGTGFTRGTLTAGTNITITNSAGGISIAATGGSPAGSDTQVQFNNAGAFGASANLNWDGSRLLAGLSSNLSGARLQVKGATDTAFTALSVNATTNDGYMGIGYSSAGSVWQIWPTYNATAGYKPLAFVVGGSEVARFPTASGFQCVNSISVGNATPTTSGAGITFPATQSASTDANTLDDYEEGTFTPTAGGGTTITGTPVLTGTYTKVGRIVTVTGYVGGTTCSYNPVGGNFITGLPFAVISNTIGVAMMQNGNNSGSSVASVQAGSALLGFSSIATGAGTIYYCGTFLTS